ncbi:DedA family protein [Enemella evansiae]|uniref:DedA family protein n=1 Tax=Enemella evansiae TaxID=2016499 RepID=UPI001E60DADC|nr:DedA family protein [Enemella evansiae]
MGNFLGPLINWLVGLMQTIGAPGAGIAVAVENIFPPVPSEVILPLAGLTASRGRFSLTSAIAWTTAGSVVGAWALYLLGVKLGVQRLRVFADRMPLMKVSDIDRTVAWFNRHGRSAVFFGRLLPLFRSMISIPAGVERMPWWQFTFYTLLGSGIWNTVLILAGWQLGANWQLVERWTGVLQNVVIAVVAIALILFIVRRVRARRSARHAAEDSSEPATRLNE